MNFTEGELKVDDLLARLELMRATAEEGDDNAHNHQDFNRNVMVANASYTSGESALDPWKRTVSQLSMGSILEAECSACRVEVVTADVTGSFYDRHRNYTISTSTRNSEVVRRYKDFAWLQQVLVHKYPFRIVPNIPQKRLASSISWLT